MSEWLEARDFPVAEHLPRSPFSPCGENSPISERRWRESLVAVGGDRKTGLYSISSKSVLNPTAANGILHLQILSRTRSKLERLRRAHDH